MDEVIASDLEIQTLKENLNHVKNLQLQAKLQDLEIDN